MGSGSLAAMAVFESSFRENMTVSLISLRVYIADKQRQEAIDLVARAIRSGVFNDLGSGSNVDVAVITKDKTEMLRNYETPVSSRPLAFPPSFFNSRCEQWTTESSH
jgi:20S proteasome subunit beta 2